VTDRAPPELRADICDSGIVLTGGALAKNLDKWNSKGNQSSASVAEAPLTGHHWDAKMLGDFSYPRSPG
jgi:actin-like ATPase involved in cell morphogenesis